MRRYPHKTPCKSVGQREATYCPAKSTRGPNISSSNTDSFHCMMQQWKTPQIFVQQINQNFNLNSNLGNICVPFSELGSKIHLLKPIFCLFLFVFAFDFTENPKSECELHLFYYWNREYVGNSM